MTEPMKIRARVRGDVAHIRILINHPMETGLRKNAETGQTIPAHFIQTVTATLNGKIVLESQWSQAISRNPYLGFRIKGAKAGDLLVVSWTDNAGAQASGQATLVAAG